MVGCPVMVGLPFQNKVTPNSTPRQIIQFNLNLAVHLHLATEPGDPLRCCQLAGKVSAMSSKYTSEYSITSVLRST